MSIYERLREMAQPIVAAPEETSYFATPEEELDPRLFDGDHLKTVVRNGVSHLLYAFWGRRYSHPEAWSRVYLAGSGVSFQWSAARDPGDLDCLVGVDFVGFRRSNPDFTGLGDQEIADHLNQELHAELWPQTSNWMGYELTFYVNKDGYDIRTLHPYAAYDVSHDGWVVRPNPNPTPPAAPEWDVMVNNDIAETSHILAKYNKALDETEGVLNPGGRLNAAITLRAAAREGAALFEEIHAGRKKAFVPGGLGYDDFNEYRYKSAKGSGILKALRTLKEELDEAQLQEYDEQYGGLPDARTSLVNAAISRRYRG